MSRFGNCEAAETVRELRPEEARAAAVRAFLTPAEYAIFGIGCARLAQEMCRLMGKPENAELAEPAVRKLIRQAMAASE